MTAEETIFFRLVDEYTRNRHRCFLAEMDMRSPEAGYSLCFRPSDGSIDSVKRYACRYLQIPAKLISLSAEAGALPPALIEQFDSALSDLR